LQIKWSGQKVFTAECELAELWSLDFVAKSDAGNDSAEIKLKNSCLQAPIREGGQEMLSRRNWTA
jgi:hypothetical protein